MPDQPCAASRRHSWPPGCSSARSRCSDDGDAVRRHHAPSGLLTTDLDVQVDPDQETAPAAFDVRPGTEEITVTGVEPEQRLSLVDDEGRRLVVLRADTYGQAHFSYLPDELAEFQTGAKAKLPTDQGYVVPAGKGYTVRLEDTEPVQVTDPFQVLGYEDHPDPTWYDDQVGQIGPSGEETDWFGYVTMRDGVQLGVNVRLPGPVSGGPYPTVIEYSGYGVSNPDETEPGSMIAGLLGFATVGVSGAPAVPVACSTCSTGPSRWTATTWSRPWPASPGCRATRSAWSACRTRGSPSSTSRPPSRRAWPPSPRSR
jgi:hypothetical protein